MSGAALALCLAHGDSAFPSGGFAFSQGLEGWAALTRPDGASIRRFAETLVEGRWASSDRVAAALAWRAAGDLTRIAAIDRAFDGASVIAPLRTGSIRNGLGFLTAHARLGTPGAAAYKALAEGGEAPGHLAVAQGLVWRALGLGEAEALVMSGYGLVNGIATAALRLGLVGALEARAIVLALVPRLADLAARPLPDEAMFESFCPFADVTALRHARQDGRLFAN